MQPSESDLTPSPSVESNHPEVLAFARRAAAGAAGAVDVAVRLYYAVRDGIRYDPYSVGSDLESLRASSTLRLGRGWCVGKAILLAACCRALRIPARLGFADVRNHLSTPRMREFMGTDVFYWHGYTLIHLEGRWVKATPAFNLELCQKFGLLPLDFDGRNDSIYHPFDRAGKRHMEYLRERGDFSDVPFEAMLATWREHYPQLEVGGGSPAWADGDFEREVEALHAGVAADPLAAGRPSQSRSSRGDGGA